MAFKDIDLSERKVLFYAFTVSAVHLLLIALAVVYLQINVPTCLPNEKLYDQAFIRSINPKYIEVHYLAKMWQFEPRKLVVPVGTKVDFFVRTPDVIHGFHINHTNVNLMAVPGVVNRATHTFAKPGIHHVVCHEYCGMGHQNMTATIEVSEYAVSVTSDLTSPVIEGFPIETAKPIAVETVTGRQLFETKGCIACHSITGAAGVGPTIKGLFGQQVELDNGTTITADEAYIIESITKPLNKLVKGYDKVMPVVPLTDEELRKIVEFIKTVK